MKGGKSLHPSSFCDKLAQNSIYYLSRLSDNRRLDKLLIGISHAMKENRVDFVKTTIIGGIFFLIPLAVVVLLVGKLVQLMRTVAVALTPLLTLETPLGALVLNLLALLVIVGFCFLAGLIAQGALVRKTRANIESVLLTIVPGYSFVKALADNLQRSDQYAESFIPVLVQFDDYSQIAFEIEREPNGKVALYLPGAPNPWSGTVVYVTSERVKRLPMSLREAIQNIRMLGMGSLAFAERVRCSKDPSHPDSSSSP